MNALIADGSGALAAAAVAILQDIDLGQRLADNGLGHVNEEFSEQTTRNAALGINDRAAA